MISSRTPEVSFLNSLRCITVSRHKVLPTCCSSMRTSPYRKANYMIPSRVRLDLTLEDPRRICFLLFGMLPMMNVWRKHDESSFCSSSTANTNEGSNPEVRTNTLPWMVTKQIPVRFCEASLVCLLHGEESLDDSHAGKVFPTLFEPVLKGCAYQSSLYKAASSIPTRCYIRRLWIVQHDLCCNKHSRSATKSCCDNGKIPFCVQANTYLDEDGQWHARRRAWSFLNKFASG